MARGIEIGSFSGWFGPVQTPRLPYASLTYLPRSRWNLPQVTWLTPESGAGSTAKAAAETLPLPKFDRRPWPFFATCGEGGPPCDPYYAPQSSLAGSDFGRVSTVFCHSLDRVLDDLHAALAEADRLGVDQSLAAYHVAAKFVDREDCTACFSRTDPVLSSTCDRVTAEGASALKNLNTVISTAGGTAVDVPATIPPAEQPETGIPSAIKWAAAGVVAIAAAMVLAPVVRAIAQK